jgi:hypothetical protein
MMRIRAWWQRVMRWQGTRVRAWRGLGTDLEAVLGSAEIPGTSGGRQRTQTHRGTMASAPRRARIGSG